MPIYNPTESEPYVVDTYTGDGSNDRNITLGFVPSVVIVYTPSSNGVFFYCCTTTNGARVLDAGNDCDNTELKIDASDGFVVQAASTNVNTLVYTYIAFK